MGHPRKRIDRAFPINNGKDFGEGMSLREYIACHTPECVIKRAMQDYCDMTISEYNFVAAKAAIEFADEMIKQLRKNV